MQQDPKPVVNILDLIKSQIYEEEYGYTIDTYPAVGSLFVSKNNLGYITGYIRTRGRGGGKYPYNYLAMIDEVFGYESNTIEICSNSVSNKNCFTVDINPKHNPSYVDNAEVLSKIESNSFNRLRADPPYSEKIAKAYYGTSLPNVGKMLNAASRVVLPKSLIFFLLGNVNRQACPASLKKIGHISISVIPNNENRSLHIYYKLPIEGAIDYQLPEIKIESPEYSQDYTCSGILDNPCASEGSSDSQAAGGGAN